MLFKGALNSGFPFNFGVAAELGGLIADDDVKLIGCMAPMVGVGASVMVTSSVSSAAAPRFKSCMGPAFCILRREVGVAGAFDLAGAD